MKEGQSSRTAEYMALFRALESRLPAGRRILVDPLARKFLSTPLRLAVDLAVLPGLARLACFLVDQRWPGARTSAVARTRFIDDRLLQAIDHGIRQVVMLGAGFDARAFRLKALAHCSVFEVDYPATQSRKQRLLNDRLLPNVRFVPVDFAAGQLELAVNSHGYDPRSRSFVIWEGVTNYLTAEAVDQTLGWCAKGAPGSEVVFTYIDERVLRHPASFFGTGPLLQLLKKSGEEWTFGFDPCCLSSYLRQRGLELLEDVAASDYRLTCYGAPAKRMRGYEFYRIARARVG